jgi:hypothetical protein
MKKHCTTNNEKPIEQQISPGHVSPSGLGANFGLPVLPACRLEPAPLAAAAGA